MDYLQMIYIYCLVFLFSSCARAPLSKVEEALRPANVNFKIVDKLSKESFFSVLEKHIRVMKNSEQVTDPMIFGKLKIEKKRYIKALENIFEHENDWIEWINQNFLFLEVYGRNSWGEVLSTGYYEPRVYGALKGNENFSRPLYLAPSDLISTAKYFTRKEIDEEHKLEGKNLELVWLNPIDAFFIHIQGSGLIELEDGKQIRVGYDGQNGHTYEAIGKYLRDIIPMEKMSMQKIRAHLQTLSKKEQQKIMNLNTSYIFFKKIESGALTYAGMEASDGRTIATDFRFFPKGALAFLDVEEPQFEMLTDDEPKTWSKMPRFVFDEDTGGAIKGGGRVDLYFGSGDLAAQKAGVMKQVGNLYYLYPKDKDKILEH